MLDIDESVLHAAEAQARQQGKPLAAWVEEALRIKVNAPASERPIPTPPKEDQGLEDNDPFFEALDEIRNAGRSRLLTAKLTLGEGGVSARHKYRERVAQKNSRHTGLDPIEQRCGLGGIHLPGDGF
jgi:hypothetical protein